MSRIIVVIQDKGGAKKSTTLIHLAHFLRTSGHVIQLVDLEFKDRLTMRFDRSCIPISPDIEDLRARKPESLRLRDLMLSGENLLIDCSGGSFPYWDLLLQLDRPPLLESLRSRGTKLTLLVPLGDDVDSRAEFAEYDQFFAAANPVKIMAVFGDEGQGSRLEYPSDKTLRLPLMPEVLARAINERSVPAGVLAKMDPEQLGFPIGFAQNADRQFAAEFSRLIHHFTP